jgi:N-acyl-D-aspartate/D-glutamate deacylase
MSSMTAARLKLFDRGLLRSGMKAGLVIFDPDKAESASKME